MIRDEAKDADKAVALAGQGLSLLGELSRCLPVEAPVQGDVEGFLRKCAAFAGGASLLAFRRRLWRNLLAKGAFSAFIWLRAKAKGS
jgi:hypothetical protein